MFSIHHEGRTILFVSLCILVALNLLLIYLLPQLKILQNISIILSIGLYIFLLQFFRNPVPNTIANDEHILSSADGKVVAIEEVYEGEYFKDKRIQISIFLSIFNVHVNRSPIKGIIQYVKYHSGTYLVAWHPKSSTENERNTIVISHPLGTEILIRQIAGAVARRISCYVRPRQLVKQGQEIGFIKFGSRVDIFLPLTAKIKVSLGQKCVGGETILAEVTN